jgi:hypothetical protein
MKFCGYAIFLFMSLLLQNCDNNITIATAPSRHIASDFVEKINGKETISKGVSDFLSEEQNLHNKDLWGKNAFASGTDPKYVPEKNPKFPLPYYLIPESDAKFLYSKSLDAKIADQLYLLVSGVKYYKLFIHPESETQFAFLKNAYRYIGSVETEFMASPTSSYRSLVVWNQNSKRKPFIVKVSLNKTADDIDRVVSENEVERSIANQRVFEHIGSDKLNQMDIKIFPESGGLIFNRQIGSSSEKLGGQLIKEIPEEIISGKNKWLSFSALMSPNRRPHPLIIDVIKKSGLNSYVFFEEYMIKSYLAMFENLSLKNGINFEPHSQNLVFETTPDLKPTGKWVLRDFGGVWTDPVAMAGNGGPLEVYMNAGSAAKYKLRGGRGNYISSYAFFYKRQVFDLLLAEVAKYDTSLTAVKINELKEKIDKMYLKQINSYLKLNLKYAPDISTYQKIEQIVLDQTTLDNKIKKKPLKDSSELRAFFERKRANQEWIDLSSKTNGKSTYFLTDHAVYEIIDNKIVGLALFNQIEIATYKTSDGMQESFLQDFQYRPRVGCFGMIKNFFR